MISDLAFHTTRVGINDSSKLETFTIRQMTEGVVMGMFDFLFKKKIVKKVDCSQGLVKVSRQVSEAEKLTEKQIANTNPPVEWQIKRASKLGIVVVPGMTYIQLNELISKAEFDRPPTHQQLKKAKVFGVSVLPSLTYGQLGKLLAEAAPNQPATTEQVELCDKVGIPLPSGTTLGQAETLITNARSNSTYVARFKQFEEELAKQVTEEDNRELREEYGDKLTEEFYRWNGIANESNDHHLIVFQRGKSIVVEVVEFDEAEIIDAKTPYVQLSVRVPEKEKLGQGYYVFWWQKNLEIKASNILHVQKLKESFSDCFIEDGRDSEDYTAYKKVLEKATEFAKRFDQGSNNPQK